MRPILWLSFLAALSLAGGCAAPSTSGREPAIQTTSEDEARRPLLLQRHALPDTPGTGPFHAIKLEEDGLANHVVYRPADLARLGSVRMPLYIFGNGACSDDGASARLHLLEIASHGYLAIASGRIRSGPGVSSPARISDTQNRTSAEQLGEAIAWAVRENARPGSPYFGRLDTSKIAVSGHSCGGLQALQLAGDPRVSTFVIMNSGIYNDGGPGRSNIRLDKSQLERLRVPILYVLGGPGDIAFPNGMDDFARIRHVPVAVANADVEHGGTFWEPNGGKAAQLVVAWLQWQLRGDAAAARWFEGSDCRLCADSFWNYDRRNIAGAGG
ncbi:hypothetical protein [Sphingosinicella sp. CPCC 101087]|uniref:hypothetical protein n=1 Tax=Sphingosinicella sp. CPCC 101087 TaxID=2497754 RepID=UPI001FB193A5|nr:hypothetical protein [Sphingosinicella sp. CPCC 101087]